MLFFIFLPVEPLICCNEATLPPLTDKLNKLRSFSLSQKGVHYSPINNFSVPFLCLQLSTIFIKCGNISTVCFLVSASLIPGTKGQFLLHVYMVYVSIHLLFCNSLELLVHNDPIILYRIAPFQGKNLVSDAKHDILLYCIL